MKLQLYSKHIERPIQNRQSDIPILTNELGTSYFIDGELVLAWRRAFVTDHVHDLNQQKQPDCIAHARHGIAHHLGQS